MNDLILARNPGSHRRRDKMEQALGFKPCYYWSFDSHAQFCYLSPEDFEKARSVGATKARINFKVSRCWPTDNPKYNPTQPYQTP